MADSYCSLCGAGFPESGEGDAKEESKRHAEAFHPEPPASTARERETAPDSNRPSPKAPAGPAPSTSEPAPAIPAPRKRPARKRTARKSAARKSTAKASSSK